jgi:hypothetical protein
MEIIIALVVIVVVAYFVFFRKADEATPAVEVAPYKVEDPVVTETASQAMVESVAPAKKPRAKKAAPAVKKAAPAKKPVAKKTATRKPTAK